MPIWFLKKQIKFYISIILLVLFFGFLFKKYPYFSTAGLTITGFIFLIGSKSYKKRKYGIKVEKESFEFLKKKFPGLRLKFRKKMRYGDIDIYIEDLDIALDVKSYRKIDNRIFSQKQYASIVRQKEIAKEVVIWLPNVKNGGIYTYNDFKVIAGKKFMIHYLSRRIRRQSR